MGDIKNYSIKGGKASGQARRNKRTFKEALQLAMSLGISEDETERLKGLGASEEDMTQQTLIALSVVDKAKQGDIKAIQYINSFMRESTLNELELFRYIEQ